MRRRRCDPLLFGKAITLKVQPEEKPGSAPAAPVLFVLSPLQAEGGEAAPGPDVCLAKFYPQKDQMTLTVGGVDVARDTERAKMAATQRSYFLAEFSEQRIQMCQLDGQEATRQEELLCPTAAPATTPTDLPEESADVCTDLHPEKAKLNFLLLLMNGVRVIFTKTLAFSTLLTLRALLP